VKVCISEILQGRLLKLVDYLSIKLLFSWWNG